MGTWVFPLWTPIVRPTICGTTVEARDHVLIKRLSPPRLMADTFLSRDSCTNGPFFVERDIRSYLPRPTFRRRTMNRSVRLFLRVLYPSAGCPQGVCGCPPMGERPSPPPCG